MKLVKHFYQILFYKKRTFLYEKELTIPIKSWKINYLNDKRDFSHEDFVKELTSNSRKYIGYSGYLIYHSSE